MIFELFMITNCWGTAWFIWETMRAVHEPTAIALTALLVLLGFIYVKHLYLIFRAYVRLRMNGYKVSPTWMILAREFTILSSEKIPAKNQVQPLPEGKHTDLGIALHAAYLERLQRLDKEDEQKTA